MPPRTLRDWEAFLRESLVLSRDYAKRGRALEPPPEFAAQDEQSERLICVPSASPRSFSKTSRRVSR
jgi:hypothetical protein